MCGIAGFIAPAVSADLLGQQLSLIYNRGPDGEGKFVADDLQMGMRRLSIIDLAGGWQPLYSRARRVVAFQNGEIYNFQSLRVQLQGRGYIFRTQSDTEVLAHGYDAWGIEGLLERIDGMYAIAIADLDTRRLHLARDRFGEKPLYFTWKKGRFAYASSLKSVAIVPWVDVRINRWSIERYLACHFVAGRQTVLQDIQKLLPGERLEIDFAARETPTITRYYRPKLERERRASLTEIHDLLSTAVGSRLISDVPVGVFLSGGIDSSLIAALASQHHKEIEAFCISFDDPDADETPYARAVASHLGMKLNCFRFDSRRFGELISSVFSALDEPIGDQAILPVYWLATEASKKVKVVLSGEGADEIFGGYSYFSECTKIDTTKFSECLALSSNQLGEAQGLLVEPLYQTQSGFPLITGRHEREAIVLGEPGAPDEFERDLVAWLSKAKSPIQRACAADLVTWLPDDLLIKSDRMTMAASIEGRAPFLDPRVVECAMSLPASQKYEGQESKVVLRQLARKLLPGSIVERRKHGFVLPMTEWVRSWISENGGFERYIGRGDELGLNANALEAIFTQDENYGRERLYFSLIALIEWWSSFKQSIAAGS